MKPVWFLAIGCCDLLMFRFMLWEAKPVGEERGAVAPVSSGSGSIFRGSAADRVASVTPWTGRKSGGEVGDSGRRAQRARPDCAVYPRG